jgi:hypothetical protein
MEKPELRVVDKTPNNAGDDLRQNVRQEKNRAKKDGGTARALAHKQGEHKGYGKLHEYGKDDDDPVIAQCIPEKRIVKKRAQIFKTDEILERAKPVPVVERVENRIDDGINDEEGYQKKGGKEQRVKKRSLVILDPGLLIGRPF